MHPLGQCPKGWMLSSGPFVASSTTGRIRHATRLKESRKVCIGRWSFAIRERPFLKSRAKSTQCDRYCKRICETTWGFTTGTRNSAKPDVHLTDYAINESSDFNVTPA